MGNFIDADGSQYEWAWQDVEDICHMDWPQVRHDLAHVHPSRWPTCLWLLNGDPAVDIRWVLLGFDARTLCDTY